MDACAPVDRRWVLPGEQGDRQSVIADGRHVGIVA
jgi:hypothetical protein